MYLIILKQYDIHTFKPTLFFDLLVQVVFINANTSVLGIHKTLQPLLIPLSQSIQPSPLLLKSLLLRDITVKCVNYNGHMI